MSEIRHKSVSKTEDSLACLEMRIRRGQCAEKPSVSLERVTDTHPDAGRSCNTALDDSKDEDCGGGCEEVGGNTISGENIARSSLLE